MFDVISYLYYSSLCLCLCSRSYLYYSNPDTCIIKWRIIWISEPKDENNFQSGERKKRKKNMSVDEIGWKRKNTKRISLWVRWGVRRQNEGCIAKCRASFFFSLLLLQRHRDLKWKMLKSFSLSIDLSNVYFSFWLNTYCERQIKKKMKMHKHSTYSLSKSERNKKENETMLPA